MLTGENPSIWIKTALSVTLATTSQTKVPMFVIVTVKENFHTEFVFCH
jgi:hypothetical protein